MSSLLGCLSFYQITPSTRLHLTQVSGRLSKGLPLSI